MSVDTIWKACAFGDADLLRDFLHKSPGLVDQPDDQVSLITCNTAEVLHAAPRLAPKLQQSIHDGRCCYSCQACTRAWRVAEVWGFDQLPKPSCQQNLSPKGYILRRATTRYSGRP